MNKHTYLDMALSLAALSKYTILESRMEYSRPEAGQPWPDEPDAAGTRRVTLDEYLRGIGDAGDKTNHGIEGVPRIAWDAWRYGPMPVGLNYMRPDRLRRVEITYSVYSTDAGEAVREAGPEPVFDIADIRV